VNQTIYDFSWLIIDDGSTDNTKIVVDKMIENKPPFIISYYYQENGGKHRAINKALELADGEYLYIVDSDDYLPKKSIETIIKWIDSLNNSNKKFIGVSGIKAYPNEVIVGKTFKGVFVDCTDLERYKYQIKGDKAEVYKLAELKRYRFPEIIGENFITEAVLWNRIARDGYYLRHFNEIIYYCEYLEDGLTKNIDRNFVNNFKGYTLYLTELIKYKLPSKVKIKAIIAYCYRARLKGLKVNEIAGNIKLGRFEVFILITIGYLYKFIRK
jgi:glycosyltransferase involved in cell wall biosynthesis